MKTKPILIFCATLLISGFTSFGAMIMHTGNYSFPLSPGSQNVALPQFDPLLGTLTSVKLDLTSVIQADITAENNSAIPASSFTVTFNGFTQATGPDSTSVLALFPGGTVGTTSLDPTDNGGVPNMSGPDYHNFGTLTDNKSANANASNLALYTGTGTINVSVFGSGSFGFSGSTDATLNVSNFGGSGTVKVTYTYDEVAPVPEPSAYALIIAGIGLLTLRNRRRSR